jgi:hypothetical protein
VAVSGDDEQNIEPLACRVELRLFQSVSRRQVFGLGLKHRDCDRLRVDVYLDAESVIRSALTATASLAVDDLDGPSGFLSPDEILGPAARM